MESFSYGANRAQTLTIHQIKMTAYYGNVGLVGILNPINFVSKNCVPTMILTAANQTAADAEHVRQLVDRIGLAV